MRAIDLKEDGFFATIKWAYQRVVRGWDDRAVWSIDQYIAELVPELVMELKEVQRGYPAQMYDDDVVLGEETKEQEEKAVEKWDTILDEIAEGFRYYADPDNFYMDDSWDSEKFEKAFDLFRENFGSLWW